MKWRYGDVVRLGPGMQGRDGRWMILAPVAIRHDSFMGDKLPAICLVPPSEALILGDVDGVWIRQMEKVG